MKFKRLNLYYLFLVSLENIQIDLQDLTRGLDNSKKELVIRQTMKVLKSEVNCFRF